LDVKKKQERGKRESESFFRNQDVFAAFSTNALNATSKNELKYPCYMKIKHKKCIQTRGKEHTWNYAIGQWSVP